MPESTIRKLKVALSALNKNHPSSIRKIANTARQFIQKTITKRDRKKPRITKPPPNQKTTPIVAIEDPFVKHERDAFRMKAFSLLTGYSPSEKLAWLRNAPIKRIIDTDSKEISLMQILKPFPGEQIELKGSFIRHSIRAEHTAPIAGSFQINTTSQISGFPHPLQHTGWALNHSFIKKQEFFDHMATVQKMLAPGTKEREHAMQWIKAKRKVFIEHSLAMHQKLIQALLGSDESFLPVAAWVQKQESPFDALSSVNAFDVYDEPFIKRYQESLKACLNPNLEQCAEQQISTFIQSLKQPPSQDLKDVSRFLENLLLQDIKVLSTY